MEAYKKELITEVLMLENTQFLVPIYQRKYKWETEQINRLLKDILTASVDGKDHFIGSIVYQIVNYDNSNKKYILVDGQQRFTTILLIVKALNLIAKSSEFNNSDYVFKKTNKIIYVDSDDYERGYKIDPSDKDREIFQMIISAENVESIVNNPIIPKDNLMLNNFITAYNTLYNSFKYKGYEIKNVYEQGLLKLSVVEIILNKDEDAQEIFESINSLGVPLSNSDLIRNYLLMSNVNQKQLYNTYWKVIQDNLIGEANMEVFVRDYLFMKTASKINESDIYKEYVQYSENFKENGVVNKDLMLSDLYNVAKIYQPFLSETVGFSKNTNKLMSELREMDQTTVYPFLMRVFIDKVEGLINDDTLEKVINLMIVYLVRRKMCKVATSSLRGFLLTLYNRVFKMESNKEKYYESIYCFLTTINSNDTMPKLKSFEEGLRYTNIYSDRKFTTYFLYRIENGRYPTPSNETTFTSQPTIEHIMPRELTEEWKDDLGYDYEHIHDRYLNTLCNLSLSSRSRNSIMSNESFEVKKSILKNPEISKFHVLNDMIVGDDVLKFDEPKMEERGRILADIVKRIYQLEDVDISGIKFENTTDIICHEDYDYKFTGKKIAYFTLFGKHYNENQYSAMVLTIAQELYKRKPDLMRTLANNGYSPWQSKYEFIHYENGVNDEVLADDIRIKNGGLDANGCVYFAVQLIQEMGYDSSELIISLKNETQK